MPLDKVLYTHMQIQLYMHIIHNHNNTTKKMSEDFFKKIYLSLYLKGCGWEGVGDRAELQHIDPHSYGHQRCVFLALQGYSTRGPGAQLSAESGLSLPHLVSNSSDLQLYRGSRGPLLLGGGFLYHILSPTHWLPVFTELYNSSIAHSIFGMACLIVIKRK